MESKEYTMIDLFCGAGIGAVGFQQAGLNITFAVDNQQYAVDTYNKNIKNVAICADIKELVLSSLPDADFITGGFPCQPFSFSGNGKGEDDERGDLGLYFLKAVEAKMPKVFIAENVKGIISKKNRPFFDSLINKFEEIGYDVYWELTNCAEYGVPQKRNRVMIVGFRKDLGIKTFKFPYKRPESTYETVRNTIGDMPEPEHASIFDLKNHYGYGIRKDELPFVHKIPMGGNWKDLPVEDQKTFLGKSFYGGGGRTGFLYKISFDRPAKTITSTMNGKFNAQIVDLRDKYKNDSLFNPVAYEEVGCSLYRRFTVRECLRLQTVPDSFYFDDSISIPKQYERCSGIPSLVASLITKTIIKTLQGQSDPHL